MAALRKTLRWVLMSASTRAPRALFPRRRPGPARSWRRWVAPGYSRGMPELVPTQVTELLRLAEAGLPTDPAAVPALVAAIYDATGVWFNELPLTPERVLQGTLTR